MILATSINQRSLFNHNLIFVIITSNAVAKAVMRLFADEPARRQRGGAANRVLEENRGAVDRAVRLVSGFV
jgi:3-deoxy-D-manno-octulosonic-acid transferase